MTGGGVGRAACDALRNDTGHAGDGVACVFYVRGSVSGGRDGQAAFAHRSFDSRHFRQLELTSGL